ncbi:MAG: aminopeptidase [Burkholderiaceae bacterium]|nr:aminopeptidase [Burkholderiaceae bacterium]
MAVVLLPLALLGGCSGTVVDLSYYWQSARGHLALMHAARPISELLEDGELDPALALRLRQASRIRSFASEALGLPENGSYTRYADLGRAFAAWNVVAAPELSLRLRQWCFPVAGCVSYRGYFSQDDARRYAAGLRAQGWDVQVAGVPAYSTLGWFDDPVLSSFIRYPEGELARLIFHELAHQVVYVRGDSTFNESFATALEREGLRRWLAARGDPALAAAYREFDARRVQFVALLRAARARLEAVYASQQPEAAMRAAKAREFAALREQYLQLKAGWGGYAGYDRWFAEGVTNAHLGAIATYTDLVPGFERLLAAHAGDLPRFYSAVRALAQADRAERDRILRAEVADPRDANDRHAKGVTR